MLPLKFKILNVLFYICPEFQKKKIKKKIGLFNFT